jgi:hypothetical protein
MQEQRCAFKRLKSSQHSALGGTVQPYSMLSSRSRQ